MELYFYNRNRKPAEPVSNHSNSSSDDEPLASLNTESQEPSPRTASAKKKRRVKAFAKSDSEDR